MSDRTFLARDKFDDPVEFRRRGSVVEYRYTNGANGGRWKEPTWECEVFTESEKAAYRAAHLVEAQ